MNVSIEVTFHIEPKVSKRPQDKKKDSIRLYPVVNSFVNNLDFL